MTSAAFKQAFDFHRAGRLGEAEAGYRQVLATEPDNPDALHFLGLVAYQSGRPSEAVPLIRQAITGRPNPIYWYNLGHAHFALEEYAAAEEAFRQAVALAPMHAEALFHLGRLHRARNDIRGAIEYYRRAVAAKPNFTDAHVNLGMMLVDVGDVKEAIGHLEQAHRLRPDDPAIIVDLGIARARSSASQAIADFQRALALRPGHIDAMANLAKVLSSIARHDEAIELFETALAQQPDKTDFRIAYAEALTERNRLKDAVTQLEKVLAAKPESAAAHINLASIYRRFGRFDEAYGHYVKARDLDSTNCEALIGILNHLKSQMPADEVVRLARLADDPELPSGRRRELHFALSEYEETRGDHDAAFFHMDTGNALRRMELEPVSGPYDPAKEAARVDRIIRAFDSDHFNRVASFGSASELPIFVVGMPRSGTTLCEQILASHSEVFGAGELPDIELIVHDLGNRDSADVAAGDDSLLASRLTADEYRTIADRHLARLHKLGPDAARVVDKMPMNYYHVGFIATLFAGAKIIHCRRDPMDIGLSCYSKDFARVPIWASGLQSIGHVYRQYDRLMSHWRRVLPIQMLELDYESVVANLEASSRRLIDYCGLEWQDSCLEFHRTDRRVKTASLEQVRKPIYQSSVGRWRKFERHLVPLRAALDES